MQFYDFSHSIFQQSIIEAVQDGELDEKVVNDAVKNVLRVKFKLGLFDAPYVDENLDKKVYHSGEHQQLAKEVGLESIVLLKNEDQVLPLAKDEIKSIAVLGDLANNAKRPGEADLGPCHFLYRGFLCKFCMHPAEGLCEFFRIEIVVATYQGRDGCICGGVDKRLYHILRLGLQEGAHRFDATDIRGVDFFGHRNV